MRGRTYLKRARRIELDGWVPLYIYQLVKWLCGQHHACHAVLGTASDKAIAIAVAIHSNAYDEILASDGKLNICRQKRMAALLDHCGEPGFDYVGNRAIDLAVWIHAHAMIVAGGGHRLSRAAAKLTRQLASLCAPRSYRRPSAEGALRGTMDLKHHYLSTTTSSPSHIRSRRVAAGHLDVSMHVKRGFDKRPIGSASDRQHQRHHYFVAAAYSRLHRAGHKLMTSHLNHNSFPFRQRQVSFLYVRR